MTDHNRPQVSANRIRTNRIGRWVTGRFRFYIILAFALPTLVCAVSLTKIQLNAGHRSLSNPDSLASKNINAFLDHFPSSEQRIVVTLRGDHPEKLRTFFEREVDPTQNQKAKSIGIASVVSTVEVDLMIQKIVRDQIMDIEKGNLPYVDIIWQLIAQHMGQMANPNHVLTTEDIQKLTLLTTEITDLNTDLLATAAGEAPNYHILDRIRPYVVNEMPIKLSETGAFLGEHANERIVIIQPASDSDEPAILSPIVSFIQGRKKDVLTSYCDRADTAPKDTCLQHTDIRIAGLPTLIDLEYRSLTKDILVNTIVSSLGILILFFVGFRSLAQGVISMIPVLIGLIASMTAAMVLFSGLNLLTSAALASVVGLGIDFSVHLVGQYNAGLTLIADNQQKANSKRVAVHAATESIRHCLPAMTSGLLTTIAAFLVMSLSDFAAFRQLGIIATIGLITSFCAAIAIVPNLLIYVRPPKVSTEAVEEPDKEGLVKVQSTLINKKLYRHRTATGLVGTLLLAACVFFFVRRPPRFSYDYLELLPDDPMTIDANRNLNHSDTFSWHVLAGFVDSSADLEEKTNALKQLDSVKSVRSIHDFGVSADIKKSLKHIVDQRREDDVQLQQGQDRPGASQLQRVLMSLSLMSSNLGHSELTAPTRAAADSLQRVTDFSHGKPGIVRRYETHLMGELTDASAPQATATDKTASKGKKKSSDNVTRPFQSADGKLAIYVSPNKELDTKEALQNFVEDVTAVLPTASGFPAIHFDNGSAIESGFRIASWKILIIVLLIVWITFRSISATMFALLPLLFSFLLTFTTIGLAGLSLNFANVVAFPMLLGLGADAGIHLVHSAMLGKTSQSQDAPPIDSVAENHHRLQATKKAVVISSLTTLAAFGCLSFSMMRGVASLGLTLSIGVLIIILSSLIGASLLSNTQ